uniref:Uncharacterized protein n=1 Tax=Glossina palpalis gambiensis TaxID=67801 RepID=A0A1B0AQK6_9MUSC
MPCEIRQTYEELTHLTHISEAIFLRNNIGHVMAGWYMYGKFIGIVGLVRIGVIMDGFYSGRTVGSDGGRSGGGGGGSGGGASGGGGGSSSCGRVGNAGAGYGGSVGSSSGFSASTLANGQQLKMTNVTRKYVQKFLLFILIWEMYLKILHLTVMKSHRNDSCLLTAQEQEDSSVLLYEELTQSLVQRIPAEVCQILL